MRALDRPAFLDRTAIVGVGYTDLSKSSGRSVQSLAVEACDRALKDAALATADVDGIVTFSLYNDSVPAQAVATGLGLERLTYSLDLNLGGQAPCYSVMHAAMAIAGGQANNVLVYRALNGRSGVRIGSQLQQLPSGQYRYPIGFTAYAQYIAMWARRYLIETDHAGDELGHVPVAQRRYSALNDRAIQRRPLSYEQYLESPLIVDPFRAADCTSEVDGACAVLVTSVETARSLPYPAAVISGAAWVTGAGAGVDIGDILNWPDYSRTCQAYLADDLWRSAGISPSEVDFAELYDCFSSVVYMTLEGLGLVPRGQAPEFVASGETWLDGSLPVNTHGGLLCEGYLHGMNTVAEAVLQIQGRSRERQVPRHRSCVVTSGALVDGSALVLVRA
jgi:acetyl-CoA acetyltransferase